MTRVPRRGSAALLPALLVLFALLGVVGVSCWPDVRYHDDVRIPLAAASLMPSGHQMGDSDAPPHAAAHAVETLAELTSQPAAPIRLTTEAIVYEAAIPSCADRHSQITLLRPPRD